VLKDVGVLIIVVGCILFKCICCRIYWQLIHVFATTSAVSFLHHFHDPFRAKVACLYDFKKLLQFYHVSHSMVHCLPVPTLISNWKRRKERTHTYTHTHTHINAYKYTYVRSHIHIYTHTHVGTHVDVYICTKYIKLILVKHHVLWLYSLKMYYDWNFFNRFIFVFNLMMNF
jgi:hypothetical protein